MKAIKVIKRKIEWDYYEEHFHSLVDELYPQRREAVLRLKNRKAAIVSLAAGLELQNILAVECKVLPKDIIIERNSNGKPAVAGCGDFHFNLSHSGDRLVIAYGGRPVGIDIERIAQADLKVAKRCFTRWENEYIQTGYYNGKQVDNKTMENRFFTIWTMKEAYLKYKGTGISVPLNSFQVNPLSHTVLDENVVIRYVEDEGYMVSACTGDDNTEICGL